MKSALYRKMVAAFGGSVPLEGAIDSPKRRDCTQLFLSLSVYLLPGALLVLVILGMKSVAIDVESHDRYLASLGKMQNLDARIDRNVLQARDGLLNNYDPIVNDVVRLKQLQTDLEQTPSFVDSESRKELDRLLQSYTTIWQQKEESILRFQSQNAILLNSLTYFPIAIADEIEKDTTPPTLANRLNALLRDILLFNLSIERNTAFQIDNDINQILADFNPTNERPTLDMAMRHARIILNKRSQVNDLVALVMELPTAQSSKTLDLTYYRRYQQALNTTNRYRL
jgi:hypothetical protein